MPIKYDPKKAAMFRHRDALRRRGLSVVNELDAAEQAAGISTEEMAAAMSDVLWPGNTPPWKKEKGGENGQS